MTSDDLVWNIDSRWFGPEEGPYTVMAKLAIANALTPKDMAQALGTTLLKGSAVPVHGRTLLDLSWARPNGRAACDLVAGLAERCLSDGNPRWWRCLASDTSFRYCTDCIALGFHSSLCQIDGLTHCPVHRTPLLDRCRVCGVKTPRFALNAEEALGPMICGQCGTALGAAWDPENYFRSWNPISFDAYNALGRDLQRLEQLSITWPDQGAWLLDPADPHSATKRRARTFEVLTSLISTDTAGAPRGLTIRRYRARQSAQPRDLAAIDAAAARRTAIYKSIRRHFRRRLKCGNRLVHARRDDLIWDYPHAVLLPANPSVSADLHGFLSWRTRFEADHLRGEIQTGRARHLNLRYGMVGWPTKWRSTDAAWANFCLMCLQQELVAAHQFRQELGGLDLHKPSDASSWMELAQRLHHRFGPVSRQWPTGVTCFAVSASTPPGGGELQLVLVSATSGMEGVADCVPAAQAPGTGAQA